MGWSLQQILSYKDIKALMADLKAVYAVVDEVVALDALDTFSERLLVICCTPMNAL